MTDGRERFHQILEQLGDTFDRKNAGYAGAGNPDPWANFRHAEALGIPASTGVLVRISDKFARLQSLTRDPGNDRVGESRVDTALDQAVYSIIYAILLEEEEEKLKNLPVDKRTRY